MKIEVSSASTYAQSTRQAPSAVTVVTREDIRRFGWRTLQDVLVAQRGFHGTYDRTYHYLGVRGYAPPGDFNNRILVLIDGMRVNDNIYDSVMLGESFPLDLALVEKVEIVRGPGASIYGGNALFGTINVVTRNGASVAGNEVAATFTSQQGRALRATAGNRFADMDWLISASTYRRDGGQYEFADIRPGLLSPTGADDERAQRFFGRLRRGELTATLLHGKREKHVPTGSFGSLPDDPNHHEDDGYTLGELSQGGKIGDQQDYLLRAFAGRYRYAFRAAFDYSADGGAAYMINRDTVLGDWWGGEGRLTSTLWQGQKWVTGLEYHANSRQLQRNFDDDGTVYLNAEQHSHRSAIYLQDEIALSPETTLLLGLRHDQRETGIHQTSPRAALVHQINRHHTLKLLYGSAFRTPNAYERFYDYQGTIANPDLKPEKMKTWEGVWEVQLGEATRFSASLYRYRVNAPITLDSATTGRNINAADIEGGGIELEAERRWTNGALLRTSYSGQFLAQNGSRPDNSPGAIGQLHALVPAGIDGTYIGLGIRGVSSRRSADGTTRVAGHAVADVTLNWQPKASSWELVCQLENALNKDYADPSPADASLQAPRDHLAQDGRQWRVEFLARF